MATKNDITNDRITNALKGDKEKYRTGWEAIFGGKDMKKHVEQITGNTPHTVLDDFEIVSKEMDKRDCYVEDTEEILDKFTRDSEDMGLYEND